MPLDPKNPALVATLISILTLAEEGGLPGKNISVDDDRALSVYLIVLASNRIDAEILNAATPDILSERFFPTPGAIAECCKPHRARIEEERKVNQFKGWVECLDPRGGVMVAPPEMVLDGMPVQMGMGNGKAFEGPGSTRSIEDARLDALLSANPDHRGVGPLALPSAFIHEPLTAEKEAELLRESDDWNALSPEEKIARLPKGDKRRGE